MNDARVNESEKIVRSLSINPRGHVQGELVVDVLEGQPDLMPVRLERGDEVVHLMWSEWDEVRDHVEYCATMMKPEPVAVNMSDPGLSAQTYRACGVKAPDSPPSSPGNQGGERCVLVYQHDLMVGGSMRHSDRFGQTWPVL